MYFYSDRRLKLYVAFGMRHTCEYMVESNHFVFIYSSVVQCKSLGNSVMQRPVRFDKLEVMKNSRGCDVGDLSYFSIIPQASRLAPRIQAL